MARLFHANFHFETELSGGAAPQVRGGDDAPPDHRGAWLALAQPGDLILGPGETLWRVNEVARGEHPRDAPCEPFRGSPGRRFEFVPWGWSLAATRVGKSHGCTVLSPPLDVVETVNRRSFRAMLEQALGIAPEGLRVAHSLDEIAEAVDHIVDPRSTDTQRRYDWVLKAEFGMAGREAIRGTGPLTDPRAIGWVNKRLARSGVVVVEPWLHSQTEASLHFDIPLNGEPVFMGIVGLTADGTGTYRSSRVGDSTVAERFSAAIAVGAEVAARLQRLGYWGPLGLDVMDYATPSSGSTNGLRPLQDLNARWTMGRLALEWWRREGRSEPRDWSPPTKWPMPSATGDS
jgi:hypothetical protein